MQIWIACWSALYLQPTAQRTFHWTCFVSTVTVTIENCRENHRWWVKWTGKADILLKKRKQQQQQKTKIFKRCIISCQASIFPSRNLNFNYLHAAMIIIIMMKKKNIRWVVTAIKCTRTLSLRRRYRQAFKVWDMDNYLAESVVAFWHW